MPRVMHYEQAEAKKLSPRGFQGYLSTGLKARSGLVSGSQLPQYGVSFRQCKAAALPPDDLTSPSRYI